MIRLRILPFIFVFFFLNLSFFCFAQSSPKEEEESLFVAKKAFEDGFYDVSLGLLERFLKKYPDSSRKAQVGLLIGQSYFYQDKFLDALAKFEELLKTAQAADIRDALTYWIAEVHFKGQNYDKAASYYRRVIEEFPASGYISNAYYSLGWCYFKKEEFTQALEFFKIIEENYPQEPVSQDASFKLIECLYNLKEYSRLKGRIEDYLKIYSRDIPSQAYLNFYLAEANFYLNDFESALGAYLKVVNADTQAKLKTLSKLGIGWSYLKLKKYDQAQDVFSGIDTQVLEEKSRNVLLLGKAVLMSETARQEEAADLYDKLLKVTKDPAILLQAYLGKADSYYKLNSYEAAAKVYQEALDKVGLLDAPQEIVDKLYYNLAWAYLKQGEFKKAIEEFRKIAQQTSDKVVRVSALCQIGDTYQESGQYSKATQAYDSILKEFPDSFYGDYVQYQLGLTMLKASNYDGAIMSFLSLTKNFPSSKLIDDAYYALALAYFQRQDYTSSVEIFRKFKSELQDSSLKPEAMYLLGTSLFNLGRFEEAVEVFKDIIRVYASESELVHKAEYEIADCLFQLGREKEAVSRFKWLRSKYPDSSLTAEIMWWLGEYYYRQNELELARRYFSSLIMDFPKSNLVADAYYILGSSYAEESQFEKAIENFSMVVETHSADLSGQAAIAIGDIHAKRGEFEAALEIYEDSLERYRHLNPIIYPKIGELFFSFGKYKQALHFYRLALEAVPLRQMAEIQLKIAEVLEAENLSEEAIAEYLKVTYLYSDKKEPAVKALLRVAAIYEKAEKFQEALNIYEKIISLDVEEAKYAKERIGWINSNIFRKGGS